MQDIEPHYRWENLYVASRDERSPFYERLYNLDYYENAIYGYYIHPMWDEIGSETLYCKILYADYEKKFAIIEMFGEWNDTLRNDIMYFKRVVIDHLVNEGINKFILLGENVLNFHGSYEDDYYAEWFEEVEDGWITVRSGSKTENTSHRGVRRDSVTSGNVCLISRGCEGGGDRMRDGIRARRGRL